MLKKIYHKWLLITAILTISPLWSNGQDSLDYYFDDGGLSEISNEISIDIAQLIDLSLSLKYNHALGQMLSVDIGGTFSYGRLIPHDIAIFTSIYSLFFIYEKRIYSFSQILPSNFGGEAWVGISFTKDMERKNSMHTYLGYGYYGNVQDPVSICFFGISYGRRIVNNPRFFLDLELQSRVYFNIKQGKEEMASEMTIGYGLLAGYKF